MPSKRYSVAEARAHLGDVIDEVEGGASVEITRRGKPVAVVVSRALFERLQRGRASFGESYRAFLERFDLEEVGVPDEHFAQARDRDEGRPVRL